MNMLERFRLNLIDSYCKMPIQTKAYVLEINLKHSYSF